MTSKSSTKGALSRADVSTRLEELPGWSVKNNALVRVFKFPEYLQGAEFIGRLAREADRVDHHPSLRLEYGSVTVEFSTHSAGGITEKDFEAAGRANELSKGD